MHQDSAHRAYGLHWVRNVVTRGAFLHAASLGLLGPSMPQPFRLKAPGAVPPGKGVNRIQPMLLDDDSSTDCMATRQLSRGNFKPGRFVCPRGACFDHEGNIYVVQWVEVGRVSKLRRVA